MSNEVQGSWEKVKKEGTDYLALGIAFGLLYGLVTEDMTAGLTLGICFGVAGMEMRKEK